ncbi:MAG: prepilin-type N-terminal cleavage/methylation domain-containing protein [Gammaproteobacteria bacterium]|nr:prepilin-type N-terminal cleavage/methylation domain-containing protein [Gammaproteobacteria bacterium]MCY4276561.1 prepilin-type N-terminal cleavage/methylation domain-containing protein [Gammaproteobacteria bacterium]MCY4323724.1 prepilin-type N-terminal cleavage/methylation domain-containing protein [Gammaproteobacteria bacterium]
MPNPQAEASGLTLIEILVALLVLSIGAFSLMSVSNQALRLGRDAVSEFEKRAVTADARALQRALEVTQSGYAGQPTEADIIECLENACSLIELQQLLGGSG